MINKKLVVVGIAVATVLLLFAIIISAYRSGDSNVSNTRSNNSETMPVFNEDLLLERGVTSQQLDDLETALGQYLISQNITPSQIDFDSIYRKPPDPKMSTPFTEITFNIQIDGVPRYKAKLDSGSSGNRLYLYTIGDGKLVYDSQNMNGASN